MKKNRIVLFILVFSILSSIFSFNVSAFVKNEEETLCSMQPKLFASYGNITVSKESLSSYADIEKLKTHLLKDIAECTDVIDIRDFNIPKNAYEILGEFIFYFLPEAFNVDKLNFYIIGEVLSSVGITYSDYADTKEEYADCFNEFVSVANGMLKGIEGNDSLSEVQKALLLHDRLALWTEYSYKDLSKVKHTAYGAFVQHSSVCQGYTMAYMYLLDRVGIESSYCSSVALNHAWNIVYIDSVPYHVDVTWDDISWGSGERGALGAVKHTNFLRSTEGIISTGHTATDFCNLPSDKRYDSYFWQNSESGFQLVKNDIYYIDNVNNQIRKYGETKNLCTLNGRWYADGNNYWKGNFSRLASGGADLIYSLPDGIYKYDISQKKSEKIFSPSLADYSAVYGFKYENGYLVCDINKAPPGGSIADLYQVKFKYEDFSSVLEKVEIKTKPYNTEYFIGDSLNTTGLSLKLSFTDGSSSVVTEGFAISGFTSLQAGAKTVKVSYEGFSAYFDVNVSVPYVVLSKNSISLKEGETLTLIAESVPVGQKIIWKSSSDEIVKVNNGTVNAVKTGNAVISAEFSYNGRIYKKECSIEILCNHLNTVTHQAVSATCIKKGYNAYITCSICDFSTFEETPVNASNHVNTKNVPATPATTKSVGYTAGVYCNDCKKYISGHSEIPKIEVTFTDSSNAKLDKDGILMDNGMTAAELLSQAEKGAVIKDEKGNTLSSSALPGTGMTLIFPDGKKYTIIVFGDTDGDGKVTASDARLALRASVNLEKYEEGSAKYKAANVDANKLTASDARLILRASVNLEDTKKWMK